MINVHFEISVAVSSIVAPKLYIRLRKAQSDQRSTQEILLTDMSFKDGPPAVYSPAHSRDPDIDDGFVFRSNNRDANVLNI